VLWTFDPEHAVFVGALDERLALYQAADDPAAFSGDPAATSERERRHIEAVDLVFAALLLFVEGGLSLLGLGRVRYQ
jgi:hypothetical protein